MRPKDRKKQDVLAQIGRGMGAGYVPEVRLIAAGVGYGSKHRHFFNYLAQKRAPRVNAPLQDLRAQAHRVAVEAQNAEDLERYGRTYLEPGM
jgi:hypothetical protein